MAAPPIVCIVGKKKSGKTTFLEKLLAALAGLGVRTGTVKHDIHGFSMDHEGKDTWRHRQAGAATVCISSSTQLALIKTVEREMTLPELAGTFFADRDIVLTEGYYNSDQPKIEVFRPEAHALPLCGPDEAWTRKLLAMVTDADVDAGVPCFGLDDGEGVARQLKEWFGL
ncbi:molybdopterin-guanine dinucleotide biosynthesis protein B [Salidesulfovibrio onnuriiensis]|uniref:molybdopterin-guanine dinucleotide biosynthesis protein B n=1 Tax=Salidesulfovibrio onnuriiensis TaxID=2583823 RepID=UPI0011CA420D|nr:molybdopterin-guanine dinucleotide biosynthesis protein B [Salidesulfovibrio onnuriiensis]